MDIEKIQILILFVLIGFSTLWFIYKLSSILAEFMKISVSFIAMLGMVFGFGFIIQSMTRAYFEEDSGNLYDKMKVYKEIYLYLHYAFENVIDYACLLLKIKSEEEEKL